MWRPLMVFKDCTKSKPTLFHFISAESIGYEYAPTPNVLKEEIVACEKGTFHRGASAFVCTENKIPVLNADYVFAHIKQDNARQEEAGDPEPDAESDDAPLSDKDVPDSDEDEVAAGRKDWKRGGGEKSGDGAARRARERDEEAEREERKRDGGEKRGDGAARRARERDEEAEREERKKQDIAKKINDAARRARDKDADAKKAQTAEALARKARDEADKARRKLMDKTRKVADIFSFTSFYSAKVTVVAAMKALNWISAFASLDREHYCMLQNALPAVLRETEKSIRKKRGGFFGSFNDSAAYLAENAALRRMVPFWQNVYYQFGLVAMTLHHALRPSAVTEWTYLVNCCETVAVAAQGILYADLSDWEDRYEEDLRMYQESYNTRHDTLRWFEDDRGGYLHVDIRRLDPILTICATRHERITEVEQDILQEVFRVEGWDIEDADEHAIDLVNSAGKDEPTHAALLDEVFLWKWKVNAGAEKTYSRIYEEAMKRCAGTEPAPRMMYVEAVNEHRRYDTRGGASIFW
jgi:hypothetical protein